MHLDTVRRSILGSSIAICMRGLATVYRCNDAP